MSGELQRIECKFDWDPSIKPEAQETTKALEATIRHLIERWDGHLECDDRWVMTVHFQRPEFNPYGKSIRGIVVCSCGSTIARIKTTLDGEADICRFEGADGD